MTGSARPWEGCETTEKAQRVLERLREAVGVSELPIGFTELAGSEPGINDLYMNLKRLVLEAGKVDKADKLLVAVGLALSSGSAEGTRLFSSIARAQGLSAQQVLDAISVATVCTVFNGYYRFRDLTEKGEFDAFRAPFNANTFMKSSLTHAQTEMICIAVSAYNGCHLCVQGHNNKARQLGVTNEQIDEIVKVASVALAASRLAGALVPATEPVAT